MGLFFFLPLCESQGLDSKDQAEPEGIFFSPFQKKRNAYLLKSQWACMAQTPADLCLLDLEYNALTTRLAILLTQLILLASGPRHPLDWWPWS